MGGWAERDINQLIIQNMQSCFERAVIYWHFMNQYRYRNQLQKPLGTFRDNESPINIPKHSAPSATGAARTITGFPQPTPTAAAPDRRNSFSCLISPCPHPASTQHSFASLPPHGGQPAGTDGIPEATHGYLRCHPRRHLGMLFGWQNVKRIWRGRGGTREPFFR